MDNAAEHICCRSPDCCQLPPSQAPPPPCTECCCCSHARAANRLCPLPAAGSCSCDDGTVNICSLVGGPADGCCCCWRCLSELPYSDPTPVPAAAGVGVDTDGIFIEPSSACTYCRPSTRCRSEAAGEDGSCWGNTTSCCSSSGLCTRSLVPVAVGPSRPTAGVCAAAARGVGESASAAEAPGCSCRLLLMLLCRSC